MAEYQQGGGPGDQADKPKEPHDDKAQEYEAQLTGWLEMADAPNLVDYFLQSDEGKKWLGDKLAKKVCDDFQRGWDNSEQYRERRRQNYRMFTGFLPKKSFPFDNCANAHSPVMMERILRLSANVYAEMLQDRETIFTVKPTGPDDYRVAEVLTLHGNWQLRNELTDFLYQQEIGVQEFFAAGSVFCDSYYDEQRRRNRHDILNCEDFCIPYVWTTVMVDLSDVPWKVRIVRKYKEELEDLRDSGSWSQIEDVISKAPPGWTDAIDSPNREQSAQAEGIVAPESDPSSPYVLLDYHGWIRMPGETTSRPIQAIVEKERKIVVKLALREEEDWRDRMRYDSQVQELQTYEQDRAAHAEQMAQQAQLQQRLSMPDVDPVERDMLSQGMAMDQVPEPTPPPWLSEVEAVPGQIPQPNPVRRVPVERFVHGRCVHNPSGALGLSYGNILADLNRLVDEAYNRYYDAATLNNIWSLLVPEGMDLGSSSIAATPGKIFKVKGVTGDQLKNSIVELRAGPPSTSLMDVVRFSTDNADSAVAAPGVLSGEPGKSGETFRGIATRVERATKQLSAAGIRYLAFLDRILVNNARLNSIFLPEHEMISVGNHFMDSRNATVDPATGQPEEQIAISRDMYRRNYSVTFTADVRFASQAQRVAEADEVLGMVMQIPQLQTNNSFVYAAVSEALKARGKGNMIPMLGPPPPPPEFPMGMAPPMGPVGPDGMPLPPGAAPPGGPPPEEGQPAGVPLPPGVTGGIQGPRPEVEA